MISSLAKVILIPLLLSFQLSAAELTINLFGHTNPGVLSLAIYNNAESYNQSVKGEKRSEAGVFLGLESYIENKKIDKNFIGIPKEQFGFSNNVMGKFSAPSFEQAMFKVEGKAIQDIQLK